MRKIIEKYMLQIKEAKDQLKDSKTRVKQLPNILTATRLFAPFVIIPMVATGNLLAAGISTLIFSVTDMIDGFLARKLGATSDLGKDLDAVTDKVFVSTLIVSLVFTNINYIIPFLLEGTIASVNIYKKFNHEMPESHMIGKIKMTSLYTLIVAGFINMYTVIPSYIINLLYTSTIGLQALTIYDYSKKDESITKEEITSTEIINKEKKEEVKEQTSTQIRLEKYKEYKKIIENIEQINNDYQKRIEDRPKEKIKK